MTDSTEGTSLTGSRLRLGARIRNLPPIGRGLLRLRRRPRIDEAHAPGHRHLGPPATEHETRTDPAEPRRSQPWIRTTHSDSQKRRPRR